ncbi:MAG: helix-turn-helix transcriptional regulator [Legionella sp.]|nr:helix-turn-helix transcriptional regulator [Legionella sp.]
MHNNLLEHPCLKHHDIFQDICTPLQELGVVFFGYTAVDSQEKAYCLGSNPNYAMEYLIRNHVKNDVYFPKEKGQTHYEYDFWDFLTLDLHREELYKMAAAFDQGHTLTLSRHDKEITHCYHFSGRLKDAEINQRYLEKMDSLHAFINFFDNCLKNITEVKAVYDFPVMINKNGLAPNKITSVSTNPKQINLPLQARNTLHIKNANHYYLSDSERQCLQWLHLGKSAAMIAEIMAVSRKTIERYIASIKKKYDCYTLYQIGEKVAAGGLIHFLDNKRVN